MERSSTRNKSGAGPRGLGLSLRARTRPACTGSPSTTRWRTGYPTGVSVTAVRVKLHEWHGEWNYTIPAPRGDQPARLIERWSLEECRLPTGAKVSCGVPGPDDGDALESARHFECQPGLAGTTTAGDRHQR